MQKLVKQVYLKMLLKPQRDLEAWPYLPSTKDAKNLLECLVDRNKAIPSMWWIDPKYGYRR